MRQLLSLLGLPVKPRITNTRRPCPNARCVRCDGPYSTHSEARTRDQQGGAG